MKVAKYFEKKDWIPLQQFLLPDDEKLYVDLYLDYKFSNLKGAVSQKLLTCSF